MAEGRAAQKYLPDNSKEPHGIQIWNAFQEHYHYKEATFKKNCLAWSTSNARNFTFVNEIWIPGPTVPPLQGNPAEYLLHQSRDKKITTSSSSYGSENVNIADFFCTFVREQAALQVTIKPFDGNSLNFAYLLWMLTESVEKKIENPMGRLTRLIKCTTGEAQ